MLEINQTGADFDPTSVPSTFKTKSECFLLCTDRLP